MVVGCTGGAVFACGLNNYGQLGLGADDTEARTYCTAVTALDNEGVVAVKGGMHHSLVLTSAGTLLAFGRSDSGQIGSKSVNSLFYHSSSSSLFILRDYLLG